MGTTNWEHFQRVVKPGMTLMDARVKESILECQVNATLAGHDIGPFLPMGGDASANGWLAECRNCGKMVWVGPEGLIYSRLGDRCPGQSVSTPF